MVGIKLINTFILVYFITPSLCYDATDYELFDLVEDIGHNFYEFLGIDSKASSSEVRKAYRRLAIQYHPDKNEDDDAAEKFTQLASIYEVLKDEEKRQKYDLILETGLPDWKQPVYYYRRVRKLGLLEITVILFAILTIGHFLVLWASYIEKKYEMEEVFRSRQRKDKRSRGRQKVLQEAKEMEFEELLQEQLETVPRPKVVDLMPCRLVVVIWSACQFMVRLPGQIAEQRAQKKAELLEQEQLEQEEKERIEALAKERESQKKRKKVNLAELRGEMMSSAVSSGPVSYSVGVSYTDTEDDDIQLEERDKGQWQDEELVLLAKAVAKFPGGIPNRWVKIAGMVGRSVKDVTEMSKKIKEGQIKTVDKAAQGITGTEDINTKNPELLTNSIITHSDSGFVNTNQPSGDHTLPRHRKSTQKMQTNNQESKSNKPDKDMSVCNQSKSTIKHYKKIDKTSDISPFQQKEEKDISTEVKKQVTIISKPDSIEDNLVWNQNQQKILEWALAQYPRGITDRWDKVAEHIPGKSKEDCMTRYKYLADLVKKKKQQQQS